MKRFSGSPRFDRSLLAGDFERPPSDATSNRLQAGSHNAQVWHSASGIRRLLYLPGAFTLLELLVVIGLVAVLSLVFIGSLGGGGKSAALQSAQATLANLVSAARTKAQAGGGARLLININPAGAGDPLRFLRHAVIQTQASGVWQQIPTVEIDLPEGVYVVPGNFTALPAGLFPSSMTASWTKSDGSALRSTALRANQVLSLAINQASADQWVSINFAPAGTTAQSGDIILATGRRRAPGSYAEGESPVELDNSETVRGLTLSTYGLPVMINDRASF